MTYVLLASSVLLNNYDNDDNNNNHNDDNNDNHNDNNNDNNLFVCFLGLLWKGMRVLLYASLGIIFLV